MTVSNVIRSYEASDGRPAVVQYTIIGNRRESWDIRLEEPRWIVTKLVPGDHFVEGIGPWEPVCEWSFPCEDFTTNPAGVEHWIASGEPRLGKRRADEIIRAMMGLGYRQSS